jgi:hypothetical protein
MIAVHVGREVNIGQPIIIHISDSNTSAIIKIGIIDDVEIGFVVNAINKIDVGPGGIKKGEEFRVFMRITITGTPNHTCQDACPEKTDFEITFLHLLLVIQ